MSIPGHGVGFHGNGKDAYVAVTSGNDDQGVLRVWVTVLNADGTVRYSRSASDDMPRWHCLTDAGRVALSSQQPLPASVKQWHVSPCFSGHR